MLKETTRASCERALEMMGALQEAVADWQPQASPGFTGKPATDARKGLLLLDGWTKLSVPSEYEDLEGDGQYNNTLNGWVKYPLPVGPGEIEIIRNVCLPDQWPPHRHYHHAWYAIRADLQPRAGETIWIRFDAAAQACAVFMNGAEAGRHIGGYTPFEFDVTALARPGVNSIAIWVQDDTAVMDVKEKRAISQLDYGRGIIHAHLAGIRGGVYLETRAAVHVDRVRIRPSTRKMALAVEAWLRGNPAEAKIRHAVYEWPHGARPVLEFPEIAVGGEKTPGGPSVEQEIAWKNPKLWSPAHPNLYVLRTTVTVGNRSESLDTRFGFREFWIEGKQFILNGKPVRLIGDGSHPQELRSIVPEKSREYNRRWLEFLKREFHFMATRLHGMLFPPWAIQAADEAGVLVINQSGLRSGRHDYYDRGGTEFLRNLELQYDEWYWRDVNSPSVVIWDVENELIRGQRPPERLKWVLQLDEFIRKHDPGAIIEHSGAAWYLPAQQIIHVHMQEQYSRIMREWRESGRVPLNMGEFWIGGCGETRLPNSLEYSGREDWHWEEARLYRERTLEMRYYGVSGIMPHRMTHWPLVKAGPLLCREDLAKLEQPQYRWRFASIRGEGARGMAPVVAFAWPRGATVVAGEPFTREIVVCNDREDAITLDVACEYGGRSEQWKVTLVPAEQRRIKVRFTPAEELAEMTVAVRDENGVVLESDRLEIHALARETFKPPVLRRRVVVVPRAGDEIAAALAELGIEYVVSESLPDDARNTIVLVPAGSYESDFCNAAAARQYLEAGGRLLMLAQGEPPRWLPVELPCRSAVHTSVPAFTGAGWASTNKDLLYTRELPVYAAGHPAFAGLAECDFKEWGTEDGRVCDDTFVRPNAVRMRVDGAYRFLLGASRREISALVECRVGAGTAFYCKAQVLKQRACPAARLLFYNLLRCLDGPAWETDCPVVGLAGDLSPRRLSSLTGLDETSFKVLTGPENAPRLVLAGDHADADLISALAKGGCTVLVLSCETCGRLPGYRVEQGKDNYYSGTRAGVVDHPLFWGIAGASFLPLENTPARGALSAIPPGARVLLSGHARGHSPLCNDWTVDIGFYGLETREGAPPIAAAYKTGAGEVVATTLEPWDKRVETHRQLLCNLLANAGVSIPCKAQQAAVIVKHTVPLNFDGRLDDWTNDMDDINISVYSHAEPILLTSRDIAAGRVEDDLDFSTVVYLLHDSENLYLGGIIFSSGKPGRLTVDLDGNKLEIVPADKSFRLNGGPAAGARLAFWSRPAEEVIDTRLLNLVRINKQIGKPDSFMNAPGATFEVSVPWPALGLRDLPAQLQGRFCLSREGGDALQQPQHEDGGERLVLLMGGPAGAM